MSAASPKKTEDHVESSSLNFVADVGSQLTAFHELAHRNLEKITTATKALSSVKNLEEFLVVREKILKDGFDTTAAETRLAAEMTMEAFTRAFASVQKQVDAMHKRIMQATDHLR